MSDIIIINFLPGEEGITWKRRKPHYIHIKKDVIKKSTTKREPEITVPQDCDDDIMVYQKVPEIKKPKPNELLYIKDVTEKVRILVRKAIVNNKNPDEKNNITAEINDLESNLKEHRDYFCNLELSTQYMKMIYDLTHLRYTFGYNNKTSSNNNIKNKKNVNNNLSEKGIQLGQKLTELKKQVKKKNLSDEEKRNLMNELVEIKIYIENNQDDFSKFDNISGRLNQIEQYKNILNGIPNKTKKKITTIIEPEKPKKKFKVVLRKHSLDTES